ncbi:MAG: hypothetical protein AB7N80_14440 [Bdellovibrionales bacterium]
MPFKVQLLVLWFGLSPLAVAMEEGEVTKSNRDLQVPQSLVKELESWYLKTQHKLTPVTSLSDLEIMGGLQRQLLDLELTLVPKTGDALNDSVHYQLPTGGGVIDLAQSVRGSRGRFTAQMKLSKAPEDGEMRVFYLSEARRRDVRDEPYGAGCNKWMELTTWFNQHHSHQPLVVYATDQRHISVLAGTWLFAVVRTGELWLGSITLNESRTPHLQCSI